MFLRVSTRDIVGFLALVDREGDATGLVVV